MGIMRRLQNVRADCGFQSLVAAGQLSLVHVQGHWEPSHTKGTAVWVRVILTHAAASTYPLKLNRQRVPAAHHRQVNHRRLALGKAINRRRGSGQIPWRRAHVDLVYPEHTAQPPIITARSSSLHRAGACVRVEHRVHRRLERQRD